MFRPFRSQIETDLSLKFHFAALCGVVAMLVSIRDNRVGFPLLLELMEVPLLL